MLELAAEDSALEDVMYALDRALLERECDTTSFIRLLRSLSIRQFHVRLLLAKACGQLKPE